MKKIVLLLVAFSSLALSLTPSRGEVEPPYHLTTVSWVVASQNDLKDDDRYITLIGHVTKKIGDESYWFTDGTGSVRLDSEKFDLPIGLKVVIGGRIDQAYLGFGNLEVDVRHWHLVKNP